MKKFLPIILYLFNIKIANSVDYFEINIQGNSIVGKLSREYKVPQEDLKRFFKVIERNFDREVEKSNHKKDDATINVEFINSWKKSMIMFLNMANATEKEISDIETLAAQVELLKKDFSVTTIGEGLNTILEKY